MLHWSTLFEYSRVEKFSSEDNYIIILYYILYYILFNSVWTPTEYKHSRLTINGCFICLHVIKMYVPM